MTTRRDFLRSGAAATTGIMFCGCGLMHRAHAQQPARQTCPSRSAENASRPLAVHSHCHFHEAGALLGADAVKLQLPPVNGAPRPLSRSRSGSPSWTRRPSTWKCCRSIRSGMIASATLARRSSRSQNEKLAELCATKPDRFAAFASLSPAGARISQVQELETAVKKQGLKGAAIGDSVNGLEFSDPKFFPVWAQGGRTRRAPVHPPARRRGAQQAPCRQWLARQPIGNPLGTTIALSHLTLRVARSTRYPGLKVIAAHGGGLLPSYADRSDHACLVGPKGCNSDIKLKKQPTEYLKQIYFDSLIFSPEAIRPSGGAGRRQPDRAGQRLSISLGIAPGRPGPGHRLPQRRRKGRHPRAHGSEAVQCSSLIAQRSQTENHREEKRNGAKTDRHFRAIAERRPRRPAGQSPDHSIYRPPAGPAAHAAILRRVEGGGFA